MEWGRNIDICLGSSTILTSTITSTCSHQNVREKITKATWMKAIPICLKGDFLSSYKKVMSIGYNLELSPGIFSICSASFRVLPFKMWPSDQLY